MKETRHWSIKTTHSRYSADTMGRLNPTYQRLKHYSHFREWENTGRALTHPPLLYPNIAVFYILMAPPTINPFYESCRCIWLNKILCENHVKKIVNRTKLVSVEIVLSSWLCPYSYQPPCFHTFHTLRQFWNVFILTLMTLLFICIENIVDNFYKYGKFAVVKQISLLIIFVPFDSKFKSPFWSHTVSVFNICLDLNIFALITQ